MTRIDAFPGNLDEQSAGQRRADAANQRDNWLRQMELAQMAQLAGARQPFAQPAGASLQGMSAPAAGLIRTSAHAAAAPAAIPDDGAGGRASDPARHAGAASGTNGATRPLSGAGGAVTTVAAVADPGTVAAEAALALSGARADAESAAARTLPPLPVIAQAAPLPVARSTAAATGGTEAHRPSEEPDGGAAPDWKKRFMHLTGEGDAVHLWIRDGELSAAQSQQLVARMAADVAAMGMRLKEATVNGKPLLRQARDSGAADRAFAATQPIIHPTTEKQDVPR